MRFHYKNRPFFLQVLCALALCLSLHAQKSMVDLHFITFPKTLNLEPLELLVGEGKTIKVTSSSNSVSKSHQVPALSNWVLGKSSIANGKFTFKAYGKVKALDAKQQLILLLGKGKDVTKGLEIIPIDYSKAAFGGGKYFVVNITDTDISGTIGTSEFSLKPSEHILLAPKPTKVKGLREFAFTTFSYSKDNKAKPFYSSIWSLNKGARDILIFYRDPKSEHLRFHTIKSFIK